MRRFILVVLGGLLFNAYAFAQSSSVIQTGKATRELRGGGLIAAHFNIPLGARVKIANIGTGKEIEVTIRGRIPLSSNRIVDLSASAWDALELTEDTEVRLVPPAGYTQETERFAIQDQLTAPYPEITGEDEDEDEYLEVIAEEDEEAEVQPRQSIKIIPGLPNPNIRKFYRLQVGAFSVAANADEYERRAQALGFVTEREKYGSLTRVLAAGIIAADVKLAAQKLEAAGFTEVWVREY